MIADFAAPLLDDADQLWLAGLLYWTVPVVLAVWVVAAVQRLVAARWSPGPFLRRHGLGLGVALAVTIATPLVLPPTMRMQFDETSLCGTAQNMHLHRTAMMGVAAVPAPGELRITDWNLDKRPTLWSFLVSVVHDVTGYRVANAFAVNLGLWFLLLATLAVAVGARAGPIVGAVVPLLLFATPLLPGAATSAGFELLATLMIAAVVLAALAVVQAPSPAHVRWLLANALLYAWTRYESVAVAAAVVILALWLAHRRRRRPPLASAAPVVGRAGYAMMTAAVVLVLPLLVLLWHSRDRGFYLEAGDRSLIAVEHLGRNVGPLLAAMFEPGFRHPFPGVLAGIGVLASVVWCARHRDLAAVTLVLAPVLMQTGIVLLWFYGDVTEPTAARLYLPLTALVALSILGVFVVEHRRVRLLLAAAVLALAVGRGVVLAGGGVIEPHRAQRLLDQIDGVVAEVLAKAPHDPARTIWVSTVAQYFVVHGRAAVPPNAFAARAGLVAGGDVFVLETPLDGVLGGWFGAPGSVLRARRSRELGSLGEIVVHRLLP